MRDLYLPLMICMNTTPASLLLTKRTLVYLAVNLPRGSRAIASRVTLDDLKYFFKNPHRGNAKFPWLAHPWRDCFLVGSF